MLDLLYPLSELLDPDGPQAAFRRAPLEPLEVDGARMPEPYRGLLVHRSDMTSTLETYHGEEVGLRLLARRRVGESLFRQVVLVGRQSSKMVELGAIRIDLGGFTPAARQEILLGRLPLGTILTRHRVAYTSRPRLFFRLRGDRRIEEIFGLPGRSTLYGRQNELVADSGRVLAEVVEILPPVRPGLRVV